MNEQFKNENRYIKGKKMSCLRVKLWKQRKCNCSTEIFSRNQRGIPRYDSGDVSFTKVDAKKYTTRKIFRKRRGIGIFHD